MFKLRDILFIILVIVFGIGCGKSQVQLQQELQQAKILELNQQLAKINLSRKMYLIKQYNQYKKGLLITLVSLPKNGKVNTSHGLLDINLLETTRKEFQLNIINSASYNIKFLDKTLQYKDHMWLKKGMYKLYISKDYHTAKTVEVNLNRDISLDPKLDSIFTKLDFNTIYNLIENNKLDINYLDAKKHNIIYMLIDNYVKQYYRPGFPIENEVLSDLLNMLQYLVNKGININYLDSNKKNILTTFMYNTPVKILELLVSNGIIIQENFISEKQEYFDGGLIKIVYQTKNELDLLNLILPKLSIEKLTSILNKNWGNMSNEVLIKMVLENGANPFEVLKEAEKEWARGGVQNHNAGTILGYLRWAAKNYKEILSWKTKQQLNLKVKREKIAINQLILKNDLEGLNKYTSEHPNSSELIADKVLRIMFTGPKELKIGKIKKLIKSGKSETIILALINRVKTPYKEFSLKEIELLSKLGFSDKIIASIINVTTIILRNNEIKQQQEAFLAEQKRIADQKVKVVYTYQTEQTTHSKGNQIVDMVTNKIINKGVDMLLDRLF